MRAVFLDYATLDYGDLDFQPLQAVFSTLDLYPSTAPQQVVSRLQHAEAVIVNKVPLTADILAQLPQLKLMLVAATGINNIDLTAARQQGICVCNCQGYGTASVAQHTMALMLALATHLCAYHQAVQQGQWQKSAQFCLLDYPIVELAGKTLGIIGYGELGKAVAKLAQAFDMRVLIGQIPGRPPQAQHLPLQELLPQVDVLSLHCPLSELTKNLIGAPQLAMMKKSSFIINTARGGIIDEKALYNALKNKHIAAAATDVLSQEPPTNGNILLKESLPNLIITPHSAWGSVQARQKIVQQLAENAQAYIKNHPIRCLSV